MASERGDTADQIAASLGVHSSTVRRWSKKGCTARRKRSGDCFETKFLTFGSMQKLAGFTLPTRAQTCTAATRKEFAERANM